MITFEQANSRACELRNDLDADLLWSGLLVPESISEGHFCVVGGVGSGKTITLRLLMQSVLPRIKPGSGRRAIIYDANQNMVPVLNGMGLRAPIVILNPFDNRCVAWDIAKDVTSPAAAMDIARFLIEEEQGQNRYFSQAARGLVGNVLKAFTMVAPETWTLADVVYTLKSKDRIREFLTSHPLTSDAYPKYFGQRETTATDIESTIQANVEKLEPIAAQWSRTKGRISLHDFIRDEFVLVLGRDAEFRPSLDALNRVILNRLFQLALTQPATREAKTWFFLDELRQAGRLEGINNLITEGRSHGIRVVIGFQDIEGLRDVYGELAADELAAACVNKAILRLDSESTARWAGQLISDANITDTSKSDSIVGKVAEQLASELVRLPVPTNQAFHGHFITPGIGVYTGSVHFGPILQQGCDAAGTS